MKECLFIDAHALQLQTARLERRDNRWHVTETHGYSETVSEKQWEKIFRKSWSSVVRQAPKKILFILPDAFVGTLSVSVNGDTNFSVEQRLQRALTKYFHFQFKKYYYRFAPQDKQRYCVQFIAKKRLAELRSITEGTPNVHYMTSVAACRAYFNTLITDRWPHIALFLEPPLRRLFGYAEQSVRCVDFYTSKQKGLSRNVRDWAVFSTEALGIETHGKRLTVIGDVEPEFANTLREELNAHVISNPEELSGNVASLSAVSKVICIGALSTLQNPENSLGVFDFSTVKIRFLSKRTRCIVHLLTAINLIFLCLSTTVLYKNNQSLREKEIQHNRLLQQRTQYDRLRAECKHLEDENRARFRLPKACLYLLDRLQAIEADGCLDELSTETSENQTFIVLKGRTELSRDAFHAALKQTFAKEISTRSLPIEWYTTNDRRNAFSLKIPVSILQETRK